MLINGWNIYFHSCIIAQLQNLHNASMKANKANANTKLFSSISRLILETIPNDPSINIYRQGNTLGKGCKNWRRAKIGERFRLFFRYDSNSKTIIFAWINDTESLRAKGSNSDTYVIFSKMLKNGNPPNDWDNLLKEAKELNLFD